MRTLLVGTIGGLVALIGFASTANASATIDLRWGGGSASTSGIADSSDITLHVVITAGENGSAGGGVTIDYSAAVGKLSVVSFVNNPMSPPGVFPLTLGTTTDTGSQVRNVNVASIPAGFLGTGLTTAGSSYLMGTITFHKSAGASGSFVITSVLTATDDVLNLAGGNISSTTTFNSATLNNVPEPGTASLLALGFGGFALAGRRKNQVQSGRAQ